MNKVILSGVTGSMAYGLNTPTSDIDMKGIYVAPFYDVIGLDANKVTDHTKKLHEGDSEYHEVAKYLKLALKCNPTILELLFLEKYELLTEEGEMIVSARRIFLSEPSIRGSYGAYAKAQADRLMRRNEEGKEGFSSDVKNRTEKHGRHCMRLLLQGQQLLQTGEMKVNVSDKRDWLFEMGKFAAENPAKFYENYLVEAEKFNSIESSLPQHPDRVAANHLLVMTRLRLKEFA